MSWLPLSPIVVMGALDRARIEPRIAALRPALEACVAGYPPGDLTLRLVFGHGGQIMRVYAREGYPDPTVRGCLSEVLQTLTVPEPRCSCTIVLVDQPIEWGRPRNSGSSGASPDGSWLGDGSVSPRSL